MAAENCSPHFLLMAIFLGFLFSPTAADYVLYPGASLFPGQSLAQGNHSLVMQGDCNLVLYHSSRPVWASQTYGWVSGCHVTMQRDGNLVVYNAGGGAVWSSGTQRCSGDYVLVLNPDGDAVIYGRSIWATGTGTGTGTAPALARGNTQGFTTEDVAVEGTGGGEAMESSSECGCL